jgi:hypothetical protein
MALEYHAVMRLGRKRDCGDLLMFDHVRRSLDLGMPVDEGTATINVADIVGTVGRAGDFDGCFRPRDAALVARIQQIRQQRPTALDEPIEVIRVDRAYFVMDGHKRVGIAHLEGREFIDAIVRHAPTPYRIEPGIDPAAIEHTAREQRFRRETGLLTAVPAARFPVSLPQGYPELKESLESYAFELSQRFGRLLTRQEAAALWHESVYLPTVAAAQRARLDSLIGCGTEADLFLSLHRQSQELWGTECRPAQEEAEHLVAKVMERGQPDQSVIARVVARARRRPAPVVLAERT